MIGESMAYTVGTVGLAKFKYTQEECERFERAKRYVRKMAGENGLRLGLLSGIRVPANLMPRRAYLRRVKAYDKPSLIDHWSEVTGKDPYEYNNQIRDVTRTHFGWVVSQKAKDLIEGLEPAAHQFLPFEILKRDGSPIERPFWLLNLCTRLDAVAPEDSAVVKVGPDLRIQPGNWWYVPRHWRLTHTRLEYVKFGTEGDDVTRIVLYKDRIAGRAIWADSRWKSEVFVSEALGAQIEAAGLDEVGRGHVPEI